ARVIGRRRVPFDEDAAPLLRREQRQRAYGGRPRLGGRAEDELDPLADRLRIPRRDARGVEDERGPRAVGDERDRSRRRNARVDRWRELEGHLPLGRARARLPVEEIGEVRAALDDALELRARPLLERRDRSVPIDVEPPRDRAGVERL